MTTRTTMTPITRLDREEETVQNQHTMMSTKRKKEEKKRQQQVQTEFDLEGGEEDLFMLADAGCRNTV